MRKDQLIRALTQKQINLGGDIYTIEIGKHEIILRRDGPGRVATSNINIDQYEYFEGPPSYQVAVTVAGEINKFIWKIGADHFR
jgi:hypothetical protein